MAQQTALSVTATPGMPQSFLAKGEAAYVNPLLQGTIDALLCAERKLKGILTEPCAAYERMAYAICLELGNLCLAHGAASAALESESTTALTKAERGEKGIETERSIPVVERTRAICYEIAKLADTV